MKIKIFLFILFGSVLSGCALQTEKMYQGDRLRSDEEVVLAGQGLFTDRRLSLTVVAIDGQKLSINRTAEFLLAPGRHVVTVAAYHDQRMQGNLVTWKQATMDVELYAIAGHSYMPQADINSDLIKAYMLDLGTSFPRGCMPLRRVFPSRSDIEVPGDCPDLNQFHPVGN